LLIDDGRGRVVDRSSTIDTVWLSLSAGLQPGPGALGSTASTDAVRDSNRWTPARRGLVVASSVCNWLICAFTWSSATRFRRPGRVLLGRAGALACGLISLGGGPLRRSIIRRLGGFNCFIGVSHLRNLAEAYLFDYCARCASSACLRAGQAALRDGHVRVGRQNDDLAAQSNFAPPSRIESARACWYSSLADKRPSYSACIVCKAAALRLTDLQRGACSRRFSTRLWRFSRSWSSANFNGA